MNIILCSDGTGNRGGKGNGTNVWHLYRDVDLHGHLGDPAKCEQVTCYDDGVGTEDFKLFKILGGAFGWGLSRNIRELYEYLVTHYRPGDRIYLFGFSRGAFTVRSLAGMILTVGIVRNHKGTDDTVVKSSAEIRRDVKRAFHAYRVNYRRRHGTIDRILRFLADVLHKTREWNLVGRATRVAADLVVSHRKGRRAVATDIGERFRRRHSHGDERIRFMGCWDTVNAVGVPYDGLRWLLDIFAAVSFHDQQLHPRVAHACHALAIDDERHTFHPVMWDEPGTIQKARATGEDPPRIEQVWFAGAHSNVGGGYPKQGMAYVTLDWMMTRAEESGLRFHDGAVRQVRAAANVHDKLYDSRSGLGAYYRYLPRDVGEVCEESCVDGMASIHRSVLERIDGRVQDYAPGNHPSRFRVVETMSIPGQNDEVGEVVRRIAAGLEHERRGKPSGSPAMAKRRIRLRVGLHWSVVLLGLAVTGVLTFLDRALTYQAPPNRLGTLLGNIWESVTAMLPDPVTDWFAPGGTYVSHHPWQTLAVLGLWALLSLMNTVAGRSIRRRYEEIWSRMLPLWRTMDTGRSNLE